MSTTASAYTGTGKLLVEKDYDRGILAIWMVIYTEACLFLAFFSSYFMLGNNKSRWTIDKPPAVRYALILLVILLSSSVVIHYGEHQVKKGNLRRARTLLVITFVMGLGFLCLQGFEYFTDWAKFTPVSDSYGSIFYTITTFHAAHVVVGLLLILFVMFLPRVGKSSMSPYRPYHIAALYWHFVDLIWVFVVIILYVIPNGIAHAG